MTMAPLGLRQLLAGLAIAGLLMTPRLTGQSPTFEVASVKANRSGGDGIFINVLPDGRYRASNATTREIIRSAYGFDYQMFQIVDGPSWIDTERFDIDARPASPATADQVALMTRSLLADRFKLVLQKVVREEPIYALVKARADGRLGPQLRASSVPCEATRLGPAGVPSPADTDRPRCGLRYGPGAGGTRVTVVGRTMVQVATGLQGFVERTVVDHTGLTGSFDGELDFAREQRRIGPPIDPAALEAPASAVSIYTALQEQLGLRLESRRGPVEVLVINRIERPTEN
jgi:uncharacterized protein (TIGR03435 family)